MKRLLLLVLMLCLIALPAQMEAPESKPLSVDEINAFTEDLLKRSIGAGGAVVRSEDGFMAEGIGYTLYLSSEDLSEDTLVTGASLSMQSLHQEGLTGPRGVGPTSSLPELLKAFPNDNPQLMGTMTEALLYLRGQLPEGFAVGKVSRDGQKLLLVEHGLYTPTEGGFLHQGIQYVLEDGSVTVLRYFGGGETLSLEAAQAAFAEAAQLQEESAYFAYDTVDPSPMQREDLRVQGLDFFDMDPDAAVQAFGEIIHEEKVKDVNGEEIRTLQFDGVEIAFVYGADGKLLKVQRISVNREGIEGPRGLRVGTRLQDALSRFAHGGTLPEASAGLYGEADKQPPFGLLEVEVGNAQLHYAITHQEQTVLLSCRFVADLLVEMSISY